MTRPEEVSTIIDALEHWGFQVERPMIFNELPPERTRCIVVYPNGNRYSVTIESADAQPEPEAG